MTDTARRHYHDEGRENCLACMDTEIAKGREDARRYQENRQVGGEDFAAAEEAAWDLRDPADEDFS